MAILCIEPKWELLYVNSDRHPQLQIKTTAKSFKLKITSKLIANGSYRSNYRQN
ncbi:MAG: hypothetical protein KME64_04320 [Scytonematopsis contorta HA4267-MV1]|jgi:hypothetical protein|nr:hypothetical protein [Scytonematopsis contorta HA4267-MV1]